MSDQTVGNSRDSRDLLRISCREERYHIWAGEGGEGGRGSASDTEKSSAEMFYVERVYTSIPEDLVPMWNHVRVEASMRSMLPETEAIVACLLETPKTHTQILDSLQSLDDQTKMSDVFTALFGV